MACDTFTGVRLPFEPNCHTTRGIRARTAPSSLQQCSDKTDISTEKAQFPLFHRPWSEVGTSVRSGILRRFHGGFPYSGGRNPSLPGEIVPAADLKLRRPRIVSWGTSEGAECESRLLGRQLPA